MVEWRDQSLRLQRGFLGDLWSRAGKGVLLFDMREQLLFANCLAEEFIRSGVVRLRDRQIVFADRSANKKWRAMWQKLSTQNCPGFGEFLVVAPQDGSNVGVRMLNATPLIARLPCPSAPAMVALLTPLTHDAPFTQDEVSRFCLLFGVTPAECRVVHAVASGQTLSELAGARGIALDTLRKQLKSAMAKCGVSTQKALISRLERFCFLTKS